MLPRKPLPWPEYVEERRKWIAYQVDRLGRNFTEIADDLGVTRKTVSREYMKS